MYLKTAKEKNYFIDLGNNGLGVWQNDFDKLNYCLK